MYRIFSIFLNYVKRIEGHSRSISTLKVIGFRIGLVILKNSNGKEILYFFAVAIKNLVYKFAQNFVSSNFSANLSISLLTVLSTIRA